MNHKQLLAITLVVLGVLMASSAQLTDLFGPTATKTIVSVAGLLNSILAGILGVVSSQTGLIKDVQSMPGVEKITVNEQANKALATLATDPNQEKIEASPGAENRVNATARS